MPSYCDLSARQRDVLAAILVEIDADGRPVAGGDIKQREAMLRDADESPYTYTVLDQLVDDDWLHSVDSETDERIIRYQITDAAWSEISDRAQLFEPARLQSSTANAPSRVMRAD